MNIIDYPLIKLLYTVFGFTVEEIARALCEHVVIIETAVRKDLKLTEADRLTYDKVPLQERLKIFDLERMKAFQVRYAMLESELLAKMQSYMNSMQDEMVTPQVLNSLAKTLVTLRAPVFKDYDTEDALVRKSAVDCEAQARAAITRLDELRKKRAAA